MKQYRVHLKGLEKRSFSLGGGKYLTLLDGAVLEEGHVFIKLYPSYVKEIKGEVQLLNEDPIDDANVEAGDAEGASDEETAVGGEDQESTNDEQPAGDAEGDSDEVSVQNKINAMTAKEEVEEFGRTLGVELDARKSLNAMKKALIEEISKEA